ncbi:hypothetical protein VB005_06738 [Metarhizium brunneum]
MRNTTSNYINEAAVLRAALTKNMMKTPRDVHYLQQGPYTWTKRMVFSNYMVRFRLISQNKHPEKNSRTEHGTKISGYGSHESIERYIDMNPGQLQGIFPNTNEAGQEMFAGGSRAKIEMFPIASCFRVELTLCKQSRVYTVAAICLVALEGAQGEKTTRELSNFAKTMLRRTKVEAPAGKCVK